MHAPPPAPCPQLQPSTLQLCRYEGPLAGPCNLPRPDMNACRTMRASAHVARPLSIVTLNVWPRATTVPQPRAATACGPTCATPAALSTAAPAATVTQHAMTRANLPGKPSL